MTNRRDENLDIHFTAIFQKVPKGDIAFAEELPGANTQGTTRAEARANLKEAIRLMLDANKFLRRA